MRFDYLNLRAIGHFTDYELSFDPAKNFHLLYGPNEAGKSTTLRSITHFLYGFPQKTNDSFLHSNGKLRIEGQIKNSKGDALQFVRRKGKKDTVLDLNGNALNEKLVTDFLQGISETHFLNMFALDHVRLREGGESLLQSGGSVGESVFSAASGISVLRKILDELEKKSGGLYKKTGSIPELNKLLKQEKELKKQIAGYQLKIQNWKELERSYNQGKQEIEEILQQEKALRSEQEKLKRVQLLLPKIAKLREDTQKFAELGEVPDLPDNSEELRSETEHKLDVARKEKKNAEDDVQILVQKMKDIIIPDRILEQSTLIDALYREVQSYQNNENRLPELEGTRKQLEAQVLAFMKEIDSLHADLEKMDRYRLSAEKKETIKELCKLKPLLDKDLERIESEHKEKDVELQQKNEQLLLIPDFPNIDDLEAVIDRVKRAGNIEQSLKTLLKDCKHKEMQINEEIRLLPQFDGTYQELIELPVPGLTETVKKFEKEQTDLIQKRQKTQEQLKNQNEAIEQHEERIRDLESIAEIPSEEKLVTVRSLRNQGWKMIRTKLHQGEWDSEQVNTYTKGQQIEAVYEDHVRDADHIADTMRMEAEKVGEKNKLLSDIAKCKKIITELELEEISINDELKAWENAWFELWKPTQINPLTPGEMKEWLVKYGQIKGMVQEFIRASEVNSELEMNIEQLKNSLISALHEFVQVTENQTLDDLLSIAEKKQKEIQDYVNKQNNIEASIREIEDKVKFIANRKIEIEAKITNWKTEWTNAIQGTTISVNTTPSVAEGLLSIYESCSHAYEEFIKVEKEKELIQEQISLFKEKVKNVLNTVELSIDEPYVDMAVNQLNAALQKAQQDQGIMTEQNNQLDALQLRIKKATTDINDAETVLNDLIKQAKCNTIEELKDVEKLFSAKKEYVSKIQAYEEELLELGNGQSLQEIIKEAEQYKFVSIEVELEEINRKLDRINIDRSPLEQAHGVVKKEYEEKIQGNNTASILAEQKKESLLAQVSSLTEQYIQIKLAHVLLQKGIEYYRSQNQDPILKRASELFARLTLQSFVGLIVDYDDKDQPVLMGVRENGDKVPLDGMSDGTTDQLYLSLRVASIEKYVYENEPIPFIVDDILVHFDDIRSKETLKILLELSSHTQIIFFTHHARLIDLMKEITSEQAYQMMEINQNETVIK